MSNEKLFSILATSKFTNKIDGDSYVVETVLLRGSFDMYTQWEENRDELIEKVKLELKETFPDIYDGSFSLTHNQSEIFTVVNDVKSKPLKAS